MTMIFSSDRTDIRLNDNERKLEALSKHLTHYANPSYTSGFFRDFIDWVLREWSTRPYYKTERFGSRSDLADFPIRSDFVLKEMQPTYRDFIHSLNGRHHFSPVAVNGTNCETLERELYDFFHESMRAEGIRFLTKTFPDTDGDDFWDRIFLEEFTGAKEIDLMDRLCMDFGFYGRAAEPYTCLPPEVKSENAGLFADWYFDDFKFAQSRGSQALAPSHLLH